MYSILFLYLAHVCFLHVTLSENAQNIIIVFSSSPQTATKVPNEMRIYYHHPTYIPGDTLRVYDIDAKSWRDSEPRFSYNLTGISQFVRTGLRASPPLGLGK